MPPWPPYLHHLTLHFPIALGVALGVLGAWHVRNDAPTLQTIVRWGGLATLLLTTVTVVTGLLAAPHAFGPEVPQVVGNHRNLGITTWCVMLVAVVAYEIGSRNGVRDLRRFGAICWTAAAIAAVGAGHWGGSAMHSDRIPWEGGPPALGECAESAGEVDGGREDHQVGAGVVDDRRGDRPGSAAKPPEQK